MRDFLQQLAMKDQKLSELNAILEHSFEQVHCAFDVFRSIQL